MARPKGTTIPIAKDRDRRALFLIWAEKNNPSDPPRTDRQIFIHAAIGTLRPRYLRGAEGVEEVRSWLRTHPYDSLPDKDLELFSAYEGARDILKTLPRVDESWTFGDLLADPEKACAFSAAVLLSDSAMKARRKTEDGTGGRSLKRALYTAVERLRRKYDRMEVEIDAWAPQQLHKRFRDI